MLTCVLAALLLHPTDVVLEKEAPGLYRKCTVEQLIRADEDNLLQYESKGKSVVHLVNKQAEITTADGKPVSLKTLKKGDTADIRLRYVGRTKVLEIIEIRLR